MPTTGWKWSNAKGGWHDDPSIKITPGRLETVCDTIIIQGEGEVVTEQPSSLGTFTRNKTWVHGKPMQCGSMTRERFLSLTMMATEMLKVTRMVTSASGHH